MGYWAKAQMAREQVVFISATIVDRIPDGHPVRLLVEILDGYDWKAWESKYHGRIGQPPHGRYPRIEALSDIDPGRGRSSKACQVGPPISVPLDPFVRRRSSRRPCGSGRCASRHEPAQRPDI